MRFPNAKMVWDWSQFKGLAMMTAEAYMRVEQWSPKMGAKGVLEQAWFRVKYIPADQRSVRTIAKVGGLVGKVMEIDEKTRYRADYVRMKIVCRDVLKVPKVAEGTLGIHIHDFIFEREVQEGQTIKTLNSGMKITEKGPDPKKLKTVVQPTSQLGNVAVQGTSTTMDVSSSKGPQQQNANLTHNSVPPQLHEQCNVKGMDQKNGVMIESLPAKEVLPGNDEEESADRVHIPTSFDESDTESDTLSEKLRKIDAYNEDIQRGSQVNENTPNQQVWFMEANEKSVAAPQITNREIHLQKKTEALSSVLPLSGAGEGKGCDVGATDEDIINSQESVITDDGQVKVPDGHKAVSAEKEPMVIDEPCTNEQMQANERLPAVSNSHDNACIETDQTQIVAGDNTGKSSKLEYVKSCFEKTQIEEHHLLSQEERRSEQLKGVIHLTTSQRNEAMAKRRNLEGNTKKTPSLS